MAPWAWLAVAWCIRASLYSAGPILRQWNLQNRDLRLGNVFALQNWRRSHSFFFLFHVQSLCRALSFHHHLISTNIVRVHLLASTVFEFPIIPELLFFCCISLFCSYTQNLANGGLDLLSLFSSHVLLTPRSIPLACLLQVLCCSSDIPLWFSSSCLTFLVPQLEVFSLSYLAFHCESCTIAAGGIFRFNEELISLTARNSISNY